MSRTRTVAVETAIPSLRIAFGAHPHDRWSGAAGSNRTEAFVPVSPGALIVTAQASYEPSELTRKIARPCVALTVVPPEAYTLPPGAPVQVAGSNWMLTRAKLLVTRSP